MRTEQSKVTKSDGGYHIRHRTVLRRVAVELVDGAGKLIERVGHFTNDELNPDETKSFGPFANRKEALNDEHASVEKT